MTARKTERLLNLVVCLLATKRFLTVAEISATVPGYATAGGPTDQAFRRMFERDKEELRDLGVPLETGGLDGDVGYRIARRDYELPEIDLAPDEAAALGLAARLWQSAELGEATARALLKLRAAGVDISAARGPARLEPRVATREPAFAPAYAAVLDRRAVRFTYRSSTAPGPTVRTVEPWGVVSWRGRWYLVGHDRDRAATRAFRLSRVQGDLEAFGPPGAVTIPGGIDLVAQVGSLVGEQPRHTARLRVRPGAAVALRREAELVLPGDGGDELQLGYADPERLADSITGFGADVVVVDPPELREAVRRRLLAAFAAAAARDDARPALRAGT